MKIVADQSIPFVREAFGRFGEVTVGPGRELRRSDILDADVLLVRSVTRVDRDLLDGARVGFVGSATIGTDHVDLEYLRTHGIAFAAAPGSNANSVAEYVVAALLTLGGRRRLSLAGLRLGIVGAGNVGSRVAVLARALGMTPLLNDPPRARAEGSARFLPLSDLLAQADVVSLHVPLTRAGPDATCHLVDSKFLGRMNPGAWLVNTSRGAVADGTALLRGRRRGAPAALVCDVWEGEPTPVPELVEAADLGTPHIAGYSIDGKLEGVRMMHDAFCRHAGTDSTWTPDPHLPAPERNEIVPRHTAPEAVCRDAVRCAYDIEADDRALRDAMKGEPGDADPGRTFDRLRREYPVRREFRAYTLRGEVASPVRRTLAALGFRVPAPNPES